MSPFGLTKCVAINPVGLISQSTVSLMKLFTYLGQVHKMISLEEILSCSGVSKNSKRFPSYVLDRGNGLVD